MDETDRYGGAGGEDLLELEVRILAVHLIRGSRRCGLAPPDPSVSQRIRLTPEPRKSALKKVADDLDEAEETVSKGSR